MAYQVLARKWRPKSFKELVGQSHVVTVLINALAQQRLHHAYLFTGTRGVGKTTIARIFAKSLNCEEGIGAEPCGQCSACIDIDQGKFVDLLEIDAASRTKVDDTREILDNVQYAPTRGRYKVYLIDEVHMLSRHSFNALLKTLEEPPEHVKFILATTDPQKLPVTVLSRCLQFHLKALSVAQIESKLKQILDAEIIECEPGTLTLLAKSAKGSMRDSLSLTDQAIAQGKGALTLANIQQMLGGIDQNWVYKILIALVKHNSGELMQLSTEIASYAPSYAKLMAELLQLLHQIALHQVAQQELDLSETHKSIVQKLSAALSPEDVQLYYQIVLNGRKDLPYASDEQAAFDMLLLRLLAFRPMLKADIENRAEPISNKEDLNFDDVKLEETALAEEEPFNGTVTSIAPAEYAEESKPETINHSQLLAKEEPNDSVVQSSLETSFDESSIDINSDRYTQNTIENDLAHELSAIERDAVEQGFNTELVNPPLEEPSNIQVQSPLEEVLATRNMLRSRKKQLEQSEKKPDGVGQPQQETEEVLIKRPDVPELDESELKPYTPEIIDPEKIHSANQVDKWANMIDSMDLSARVRQLAIHATIDESSTDDVLKLSLNQSIKHLNSDAAHELLARKLTLYLERPVSVEVNIVDQTIADPYQIQSDINDKRLEHAIQLLKNDEVVVRLQQEFQAELDESTISAR